MKKSKKDAKKKRFKFGKGKSKEKKTETPATLREEPGEAVVMDLSKFEMSSSGEDANPNTSPDVGVVFGISDSDDELYLKSSEDDFAPADPVITIPVEDWNNEPTPAIVETPHHLKDNENELSEFNMFSNPLSGDRQPTTTHFPEMELLGEADEASLPKARRNAGWKKMEEQRRLHAEKKRLLKQKELEASPGSGEEKSPACEPGHPLLVPPGSDLDIKRATDDVECGGDDEELFFWGSEDRDDPSPVPISQLAADARPSQGSAFDSVEEDATQESEEIIEEEDATQEEEEKEKRMLESLKDIRREKQEEEERRRRQEAKTKAVTRKKREHTTPPTSNVRAPTKSEPPSLLWADDDDIWDGDDTLYAEDRSYDQMELERKYPIRLPQREGKMYVKKEGRPKWIHEWLVLKEDKLFFLSKAGKLPPLRIVSLSDKKTTFVWHKEQALHGRKKTKAFIVMSCSRGVYHIADPSPILTEEWRSAIEDNRQRDWAPQKRKTTKSTKTILFRNT